MVQCVHAGVVASRSVDVIERILRTPEISAQSPQRHTK